MRANLDLLYSRRGKAIRASEIRELLKLTQKPDIISFAGGLPNPKTFPVEELEEVMRAVIVNNGPRALQYGATEGYNKLRRIIAKRLNEQEGMDVDAYNVLITHGSQQGLDILGKLFLNHNDILLVGAPSYLGATNAFAAYRAKMETVPLDENGMRVDILENMLEQLRRSNIQPKFVYTVPTFQNPMGVTMSLERRKKLLELASEYGMLIIEDNPYGELRYEGEHIQTMKSLDTEGNVVYLGTFSKIFAPGFRVAFMVANEELTRKFTICKQSLDLCTNTFSQYIIYEFMRRGLLSPLIEKIRKMYKRKRDIMLDAMDYYFPEEAEWTTPKGGMFLWVTLPQYCNTREMLNEAVNRNVAYVIGSAFFANGGGYNTMRINFSHSSDDNISEGVKRLGNVIRQNLKSRMYETELITGV